MNLSEPTSISCVIPTHRRPDFLREALCSVLAQTVLPNEIIIVDDDADKQTRDVVSHFEAISPVHVRYVDASDLPLKNAGASRNLGASLAISEYLTFLDDDDWWEPAFIESLLTEMREERREWGIGWCTFVKDSHRVDGHSMPSHAQPDDAFRRNPGMTGSNFVIRRSLFETIGGFDPRLRVSNDRDLLIRLLQAGAKYAVTTKRLCMQRAHDSGQLTTRTEARAEGIEAFMAKHQRSITRLDRRYLMRELHSIRRVSARGRGRRIVHAAAQVLTYRPPELIATLRRKLSQPSMY